MKKPNDSTQIQQKVSTYITTRGNSNSVPKYFRTLNKVFNRNLSKRTVLNLIFDLWNSKKNYEQKTKCTLNEFFYPYLKKKFGNHELICEWAYNLYETCSKNRDTSIDCYFFILILNEEIDENNYKILNDLINEFKSIIINFDLEVNNKKPKGFIDKSEFFNLLNKCYPRSKKQLQQLNEALKIDQDGDTVIYRFLFDSESESNFFEVYKRQFINERNDKLIEIIDLFQKANKEDTISYFDISRIIRDKDSNCNSEYIDDLVSKVSGVKLEEFKPKLMIGKKELILKLKFSLPVINEKKSMN